jgi:hypothetical protein
LSQPSNVVTFSVFYSNPLPASPSPISPAGNPTLTLPVTLQWTASPNPQPVRSRDREGFGLLHIEEDDPQLNEPSRTVLSLTHGVKFWRAQFRQFAPQCQTAAPDAVGEFIAVGLKMALRNGV